MVVFSKTVKAVVKPILVHYLDQRVLQMDKFLENSESNSAKYIHFSIFQISGLFLPPLTERIRDPLKHTFI